MSEIIDTSVDIIIKDFTSVIQPYDHWRCEKNKKCGKYTFCVSVDPNGYENKGYILVHVNEIQHSKVSMSPETFGILRWTVSIIDSNGTGKHFVSFQNIVEFSFRRAIFDFVAERYKKLSFLFDHADELLPEDVLTLRFDISYISCAGAKNELDYMHMAKECQEKFYTNILASTDLMKENKATLLNKPLFKNEKCGPEISNFTNCSIPSTSLGRNENGHKLDKNDWVIKTSRAKFVISLIAGKDTYGSKLMSASPVFKFMISIDMKEKHTKCIDLSRIETEIFHSLLYFLENGTLDNDSHGTVQELYVLAHMYMMEELQHACTAYIAESLNYGNFNYWRNFAYFYGDKGLIDSVNLKYCQIFRIAPNKHFKKEHNSDKLDFDFYV